MSIEDDGSKVFRQLAPSSSARGIAYDPEGAYLAVVSANGVIHIWDVVEGSSVKKIPLLARKVGIEIKPFKGSFLPTQIPTTVMLYSVVRAASVVPKLSIEIAGIRHTIKLWNLSVLQSLTIFCQCIITPGLDKQHRFILLVQRAYFPISRWALPIVLSLVSAGIQMVVAFSQSQELTMM